MTQPASTGTGLFGSTTTQPSGFGATQNPSTSTGTGLFGSTQQQPSTGIFGSTTTGVQGTGMGGGLPGATNPQQQQQQPQQGSIFGNTGATPAQPSTGGGLFGSTTTGTTQPSTGGLFGTGTSTQGTSNTIFGTPATTSSTTGGGLFGGGTGTTTGGGLFGSTTQSTPSTGGGLFGSQPAVNTQLFPQTTAQQPLTTSIFGTSTATQPQQTQLGLFVQSTGGFGGNGGGLLSNTLSANTLRTSLASSQWNSDPGAQCAALMQRIEGIKNAWDAGSPQCKFQVGSRSTLRFQGRLSNSRCSYLALLL